MCCGCAAKFSLACCVRSRYKKAFYLKRLRKTGIRRGGGEGGGGSNRQPNEYNRELLSLMVGEGSGGGGKIRLRLKGNSSF